MTGCGTAAAPDGTSCGDSDCTTSQVCISGACEARATPQGTACGAYSPCQAQGHCVANTCERQASVPLVPVWEHVLPKAGWDFRGVTDSKGNLYWLECGMQCQLVSFTPAGALRFMKAIPGLEPTGTQRPYGLRHMVAGDRVYVIGKGVLVYSTSTEVNGPTWVKPEVPGRSIIDFAADSSGHLRTLEHPIALPDHHYFVAYDGRTGQPVGTYKFHEYEGASSIALDAAGNAFASVTNHSFYAPRIVSLAPDGAERFRVPGLTPRHGATAAVHAVYGGSVLMADGEVRSTSDGRLLLPPSTYAGFQSSPRGHALASPAWWYWWNFATLAGLTYGSLAVQYTFTSSAWVSTATDALLLSNDTVLFAEVNASNEIHLRAVDSHGAERFSCRLDPSLFTPGPYPSMAGAALADGRFALYDYRANSIRVYATPKLSLAPTGWVGRRGSPGYSGQAR